MLFSYQRPSCKRPLSKEVYPPPMYIMRVDPDCWSGCFVGLAAKIWLYYIRGEYAYQSKIKQIILLAIYWANLRKFRSDFLISRLIWQWNGNHIQNNTYVLFQECFWKWRRNLWILKYASLILQWTCNICTYEYYVLVHVYTMWLYICILQCHSRRSTVSEASPNYYILSLSLMQ